MLDVSRPNQIIVALGMGKSRNDELADYYLRAAGVAAVWIDADGCIGADETASLKLPEGRIAYCCARGAQFVLAYRLQIWKQDEVWVAVPTIAAKLEEMAQIGGVGLTPHQVAIRRALEAVATVDRVMDDLKAKGGLKPFNQAFKAARAVDGSIRYGNYLHAHKAGMLEKIAKESR